MLKTASAMHSTPSLWLTCFIIITLVIVKIVAKKLEINIFTVYCLLSQRSRCLSNSAIIYFLVLIQGINGSEHGKVDLKEKLDQRAKRFNTENLGTEVRPKLKANTRDIERSPLSLILLTPSNVANSKQEF